MAEPRIQAIQTGFDILQELIDLEGSTVSELADSVDMPVSTTHDYLNTLGNLGYVYQRHGEYYCSLTLLRLGEATRRNTAVFEEAETLIRDVAQEMGVTLILGVEENEEFIVIDYTYGQADVSFGFYLGMQLPAYASAAGKVVLAHLPAEKRDRRLQEMELTAHTPNTITDREQLEQEIESIAEEGVAYNDEEFSQGIRAVAVPIKEAETFLGTVAAVDLSRRMTQEEFRESIPEQLQELANLIEVSLSGPVE